MGSDDLQAESPSGDFILFARTVRWTCDATPRAMRSNTSKLRENAWDRKTFRRWLRLILAVSLYFCLEHITVDFLREMILREMWKQTAFLTSRPSQFVLHKQRDSREMVMRDLRWFNCTNNWGFGEISLGSIFIEMALFRFICQIWECFEIFLFNFLLIFFSVQGWFTRFSWILSFQQNLRHLALIPHRCRVLAAWRWLITIAHHQWCLQGMFIGLNGNKLLC